MWRHMRTGSKTRIDLSVVGSMQKVLSNGDYKTKLIAASFKTLTQISKMAELPIYGMSLPVGMYNEFSHTAAH